MKEYLKDKNIRLRCKKNYPEAHTHIIIGKVVEETCNYIAVKGRTFHFRRIVDQMISQVHCGDVMVRATPWENVEVIHWLDKQVDYNADISFDARGNLILNDKGKTIIAAKRDGLE
ncbi:MAG: hypothetical protein WC071_04085 [Victivallaceae bacterium]